MAEKRPDVSIYLIARDAAKVAGFLCRRVWAPSEIARWIDPENGKIGHSEFRIGSQRCFSPTNIRRWTRSA